MEIVKSVSRNLVKLFKFPGFDEDDLMQEAAIIGLAALKDFKQENGSVEQFLYISIKNGLYNLKQKHFYDRNINSPYMDRKKKVVGFVKSSIDYSYDHPFEDIEIEEIENLINRYLHPHMKEDYNKLKEGVYVSTKRRKDILFRVKQIYDLLMEDNIGHLEQQLQNGKTR